MPTRSSSRVFNGAALEVWFQNVGLDWERSFDREALRRGREIYRQNLISGIELAEGEVIVNCAFSRKDTCYAIIEWTAGGPTVRSSTDDEGLGRAVAVGGLYEVEELIGDEIDQLTEAPEPKASDRSEASEDRPAPEVEAPAAPPRRLRLDFQGRPEGLRVFASWLDSDEGVAPAFAGSSGQANAAEREILIRLTGRARKAGFLFQQRSGSFLLAEPERIAAFLGHGLSQWRKAFDQIRLDLEAERMARGVRSVSIAGQMAAAKASGMRIDWKFKLEGRLLDREDMARLARAGPGVHILPGLGLINVGADQASALKHWRVAASAAEGPRTWPRYMAFSLFGDRGAKLSLGKTMETWRASIRDARTVADVEPLDNLRDYQVRGVRWLAGLCRLGVHALLADEMGLGKTLQMLTLLKFYETDGLDSLIVCPASVIPVWQNEAARWYPDLRVEVLRSGHTFAGDAGGQRTLWVVSYTQLRRHKHLLPGHRFGFAVLDEAHQIKNPDSKISQACSAIESRNRLALTGTPIENRLLDLWTLFRFLMPGLLGSRRQFEEAANHPEADIREAFQAKLHSQIRPFILRRTKDEVGEALPPKVEVDLVCPISPLQRAAYERLLAEARGDLGADLGAAARSQTVHFLSYLTRLRQACCDPGLLPGVTAGIEHSGKVSVLLARLEEAIEPGSARKVVVFSQFVQFLDRLKPALRERFPQTEIFELSGRTRDRAGPVDRFQSKEGSAVFLISLKAGGVGITLHAADYVFLLDPWWNPAAENQAIDRVHRIGQDKHVFVYRMVTRGTVEARVQALQQSKRRLFDDTLGDLSQSGDLVEHLGDIEQLVRLLPGDG